MSFAMFCLNPHTVPFKITNTVSSKTSGVRIDYISDSHSPWTWNPPENAPWLFTNRLWQDRMSCWGLDGPRYIQIHLSASGLPSWTPRFTRLRETGSIRAASWTRSRHIPGKWRGIHTQICECQLKRLDLPLTCLSQLDLLCPLEALRACVSRS